MNNTQLWLLGHRYPTWLGRALADPGLRLQADQQAAGEAPKYEMVGGSAVVSILGPLAKGRWVEFWGGTSAEVVRSQVVAATVDKRVHGIFLRVDSPGGEVAGVEELANAIHAAAKVKPVHVHAEDLMASAALWAGTQGSRLTANATAEVGSIGTVAVVWDTSKLAEDAGIQVHVVSTAPLKGSFVDGAPISEEALEELQRRVNDLNGHFLKAITRGRGLRGADLTRIADGRVYGAAQAKRLGLIDEVQGRDEAFGALGELVSASEAKRALRRGKRRAAELKPEGDDLAQRRTAVLARFQKLRAALGK